MDNRITVIYGARPEEMTRALLEAEQLAQRIPPDALIGLKPNLVVAKPADSGATTHPEIVGAVIEYLQAHGRRNLLILEGAWVGDSTKRAFRACGYEALSQRYGVPLFDTKGDAYETRRCGDLAIAVCKKALEVDFMINFPVLKGHCQTMMTGALKNMKGLIPDTEKRRFHSLGLHRPIACLNKVLKQDYILVDGLCGDLDFEEGGNPVRMNRIFGGTDPVLIDSYIASCMGYRPEEIGYLRMAANLGVGSMALEGAKVWELNRDTGTDSPASTRKVQRLADCASPREACSACYANLIQAFARLDEEGGLEAFRKAPVSIGQGYRGQCGNTLGIGDCAKGCDAFIGGCPPSALRILEFLHGHVPGKTGKACAL